MLSATEEDYQEAFFLWILSRGTAPWNRNSVAGTHSPRTPRPTQWVHAAGTLVSGHTNRADWTGLNAPRHDQHGAASPASRSTATSPKRAPATRTTVGTTTAISSWSALVADGARAGEHAAYRVEGGTHADGFAAIFPDRLRPMLPCARTGFTALTDWVEKGIARPAEGDVARPASGDLVNMWTL